MHIYTIPNTKLHSTRPIKNKCLTLLALSPALDQQTHGGGGGGRKKKEDGERGTRARLVNNAFQNEASNDFDRRLSFMLVGEPIKIELMNSEPPFWKT